MKAAALSEQDIRKMSADQFVYQIYQDYGLKLRLARCRRRFLGCLLKKCPLPVPHEQIVDAMYFDDPDGGPLGDRAMEQSVAWWLRRALKETPFEIQSHYRYGYALVLASGV